MKLIDSVLIAVLAAVIGLAIRRVVRTRRSGGCGCGCPGCTGNRCSSSHNRPTGG